MLIDLTDILQYVYMLCTRHTTVNISAGCRQQPKHRQITVIASETHLKTSCHGLAPEENKNQVGQYSGTDIYSNI